MTERNVYDRKGHEDFQYGVSFNKLIKPRLKDAWTWGWREMTGSESLPLFEKEMENAFWEIILEDC